MAALLQHICRRQIHGDPFRRQRQPHRAEGGTHPLLAFGDRLVGQPDDGEGRQPTGHLNLDVDVQRIDPLKRNRGDSRDHGVKPFPVFPVHPLYPERNQNTRSNRIK